MSKPIHLPGDRRGDESRLRAKPPRFVRSGKMVDCLRREGLYSEKRARDFLFSAIESSLSEPCRGPMIVSRLTREAAQRARESADQAGFEFDHWSIASRAVLKAMLSAGALLVEDGSPIPLGITAQATPVAALHDRYQDLTEAFLLECVIRGMGDVTMRDHTALAHALFRQFDPNVRIEDLEDRVVILLANLADRVDLRDEAYYLAESSSYG